ncbi:hypothetical protein PIB30_069687 [Stylosanthes scabra]|uniref:Uncharacterized protein n=1 Tax=Stylosanthes scabra TaxID=79078 RepID=A0ABU6YQ42_9FABA|nr:hypothetical protein [Stylosanthes scabra]
MALKIWHEAPRPILKSGVSLQISSDRSQGNRAKFSLKRCHRGATKFENTEYWTQVVLHRKQKQRLDDPRLGHVPNVAQTWPWAASLVPRLSLGEIGWVTFGPCWKRGSNVTWRA